MNDTYVNQFPTLAPSYVLLTLSPNVDEYEYLQRTGEANDHLRRGEAEAPQ